MAAHGLLAMPHVTLQGGFVNRSPMRRVNEESEFPLERTRMFQRTISSLIFATATLGASAAFAQTAPDAMIKQVSGDVIDSVKGDKAILAGDVSRIQSLVDSKVMPHVDFQRMTAAVVGKYWKTATPDQQQKLQAEFKTLLIRTYAGALTRVQAQTTVELKPLRAAPDDSDVTVRTEIKGNGDPVQLDYRLEKLPAEWKIFDVNVLGVWLVDQYKSSFAQEISANGVDGLITKLVAKNKAPAAAKG
jgi:phospholipid transport system substrate-binding protein